MNNKAIATDESKAKMIIIQIPMAKIDTKAIRNCFDYGMANWNCDKTLFQILNEKNQ